MAYRFMVLGLGGSGIWTLRALKGELLRRLRQVGWTGGLPEGWRLLGIDTPADMEGGDSVVTQALPRLDSPDEYLGLVPNPETTHRDVYQQLVAFGAYRAGKPLDPVHQAITNWPRPITGALVHKGAGQYRAIGRPIAAAALPGIGERIARTEARMHLASIAQELNRVNTALGIPASEDHTLAMIVSSVAGGTGAGVLIDVCDILREKGGQWGDEAFTFIYLPDVLDDSDIEPKTGFAPNTLAAISEIMAGGWSTERSEGETQILAKAGVVPKGPASGPTIPLLIGRGGTVKLGSRYEVYTATANVMAAIMTSGALQQALTAYGAGSNRSAQRSRLTNSTRIALKVESGTANSDNPFYSLGASMIDLGHDRFGEYATERLASGMVMRLKEGHWLGQERNRPDHLVIAEAAEAEFEGDTGFRARAGLDERGKADQILDAIRMGNLEERRKRFGAEVVAAAGAGIRAVDGETWFNNLYKTFRNRYDASALEAKTDLHRAAAGWVKDVQERYVALTEELIAKKGLKVAAAVLRTSEGELTLIGQELAAEAVREEAKAKEMILKISGLKKETQQIAASSRAVTAAVGNLRDAFGAGIEKRLREVVAEVTAEMAKRFVRPLRLAVEAASPDGGGDWCNDQTVSKRLRPSPTHVLVDSHERFAAVFVDLVAATTGVDKGSAEAVAVAEATWGLLSSEGRGRRTEGQPVKGGIRRDDVWETEGLVTIRQPWIPASDIFRTGPESSQEARFTLNVDPESLLVRARAWVTCAGTPIGGYVDQTLLDYLTQRLGSDRQPYDLVDYEKRLERYLAALRKALGLARPLAEIDTGAMQRIHGAGAPPTTFMVSGIPLPEQAGDAPFGPCELTIAEIRAFYPAEDEAGLRRLTGLGSPSRIEFANFQSPVDAGAVKALTQSIIGKRDNPNFWQHRRTRSLPAFIPAPTEVRQKLITGYFVANLLKELRVEPGPGGWKAEVFDPNRPQPAQFPYPQLSTVRRDDVLAALLETLPVALLEYSAREDALRAYWRLMELAAVENEFTSWVDSGPTPRHAAFVDGMMAAWESKLASRREEVQRAFGASDRQARLAHLQKELNTQIAVWDKILSAAPDVEDPARGFLRNLVWELRRDIQEVTFPALKKQLDLLDHDEVADSAGIR